MGIATLDRAASLNRWRHRALSEKALIGLGFLLLAVLSLCWPLLRKVLSNRKKAA